MRPKRSRSSVRLVAFWAAIVAVVCVPREAAPGDAHAPLTRRIGLTVVQDTPMTFGTLADTDGYVEIGPDDDVLANPHHIQVDDTVFSAVFDITGDPDRAFSMSIAGDNNQGLTLNTFRTDQGEPPLGGLVLDGTGQFRVRIGARITVDASQASPGADRSVPYTITVLYE